MGCSRILPCLLSLSEIVPIILVACVIRFVKLTENHRNQYYPFLGLDPGPPSLRVIVEPIVTFAVMLAIPLVYVLIWTDYPALPCKLWVSVYGIHCIAYTISFCLHDRRFPSAKLAFAVYLFDISFFAIPGTVQLGLCAVVAYCLRYFNANPPNAWYGRDQEHNELPPCPFCGREIPMPEFNFDVPQLQLD